MSSPRTPAQFFAEHYRLFAVLVPGVRDGNADAVHDARVAVRRMRATLPLLTLPSSKKVDEHWAPALRDIGRALGGARDLDVSIDLLREFERRVPPIACLIVTMRQSLEAQQGSARRKAIKQLEASKVESVLHDLEGFAHSSGSQRSLLRPFTLTRPPTNDIWRQVAQHARSLSQTVEYAGGVYFPDRVHSARIDAKKLRYALEIAAAAGAWRADSALITLKRTQEVLGRLHDRQVLIDLLEAQVEAADAMEPQREMFARILEAERDDLHQKYVAKRPDLLSVCTTAQHLAGRATGATRSRESWMACGAVAVSAGLWFLTRRRPAETASETAWRGAHAPEPEVVSDRGRFGDHAAGQSIRW